MAASIIDQYGNPITPAQIARLREEVAGPTLTGVRPVISGSPADGMTPARLGQIHRAAADGDSLAYMELAEDLEERDTHYAAVLGTRRRQVAQLPVTVEAASDSAEHEEHAEFLRDWLKRGVLERSLFDLLDAISKGFCVMEIMWSTEGGRFVPGDLIYRPQRWFEPDRTDGRTVLLRDLLTASPYEAGDPRAAYNIGLTPLAEHKFVVHLHPSKSGNLIRSGIARPASWAWMYKAFTLRDWAVFTQSFGMPIRVGRYGPDASGPDRDVLWQAVSSIAGDMAAILPKSMEIEFKELGNLQAGADLYEKRADWHDRQVSKLVLGQTATTDAIAGGHAVGREHRLVQEDLERSDSRFLTWSCTQQLGQRIIALNFPGTTAYPIIRIGRPDELPIEVITAAMQWLGPQGLKLEAGELRDRLGFSQPAPGAEVVGGAPPPPPIGDISPPHVGRTAQEPFDAQLAGAQPGTARQTQRPGVLRARHSRAIDPELLERLQRRMEMDAQSALTGLTDQVRAAIEAAADLPDLVKRLDALKLDDTAFALALQRGIAVAHLTGQAALIDELTAEG